MIRANWFWRLFAACVLFLTIAGAGLIGLVANRGMSAASLAAGYAAVASGLLVILFVFLRPVVRDAEDVQAGLEAAAAGKPGGTLGRAEFRETGPLSTAFNRMSSAVGLQIEATRVRLKELEDRERFLQTVLGTMVEAVVAVDGRQKFVFANDAARTLLDLRQSDMTDRPIWEATRAPGVRDALRSVLEDGVQRQIELELVRTRRVATLTASRLPGDPPPGAVLVLHDVTELRRLENLRREFVSNVSHELKTPLSTISACAETLLDGAIDDRGCNREFLGRIQEQADRLHMLILDLIALARIESDEQVFDMEPVSLRRVVGDCVRDHIELARSKSVELTIEPGDSAGVDGNDDCVQADPEGMRTILDNLVDNAIHYTPAGGRVVVGRSRDGSVVRISVADTGIGIPSDKIARIFERFYRVDKARSREHGGTGLGLAIVKHLVKVFGGDVSVSSEPGKGSTFVVELPATNGPPR